MFPQIRCFEDDIPLSRCGSIRKLWQPIIGRTHRRRRVCVGRDGAREASQWPEAIKHFSRATELDAGFGDAFLGLDSAFLSARQFSDAIPPLQTAVKLEPRNPGAHYNLATALTRAGRKDEAGKEFAIHRKMTQKDEAGQGQPTQPQNRN